MLDQFQQFGQQRGRETGTDTSQNGREPKADGALLRRDWRVYCARLAVIWHDNGSACARCSFTDVYKRQEWS